MVFCFSATGNSLYVARALDDDVRSIAHELKQGPGVYRADTIGIVTPVYYHELPAPVRAFIREATFECDYFYVVGTYGCKHGGFAELTHRFLDECGLHADYINTIKMVDNALPGYDIAEELRIDPEKHVDEHLAQLANDIANRRSFIQPVSEADLAHHFAYVERGTIAPTNDDPLYVVTDVCTGCGTCVRVCPMDCIRIVDGRAQHAYDQCAICMGCIHACPTLAIQFATLSEKNPGVHYRNPHVALTDLFALND